LCDIYREGGIPEPPHCFVCVLSTTDRDEMARLIGSSNKSAKSSSDFIESSFVEEKQPKPKPSKTMSDKRGKLKKKRKNNGIAGACTCAGKCLYKSCPCVAAKMKCSKNCHQKPKNATCKNK
ncbi:hypothetical protein ADUPG1_011934, partial [Aduncisulcus paluster]